VVRALGGHSGVESTPGRGSTFWFSVPVGTVAVGERLTGVGSTIETEPNVSTSDRSTSPIDEPAVPTTILVVDDSETNLLLVDRQLRTLGHEVVAASSGRDALALMSATFDLVLMDVNMPDLDGVETTRRLRALGWTTPIVAFTAATTTTDRAACQAVGMDDFLAKPIGLRELGTSIDRVLDRHASRRAASTGIAREEPAPDATINALVRDIGPDATLRLLEVFLAESANQHQVIASSLDTTDEEAFRRATHTLAATSALVGGTEVEKLCRAAEQAGLAGLAATDAGELLGRLTPMLTALWAKVAGAAKVIGQRAA
jgi:CheY-like chemotaxis protein/HPt (histidine-containing phosphotransfer) domain-containing protein